MNLHSGCLVCLPVCCHLLRAPKKVDSLVGPHLPGSKVFVRLWITCRFPRQCKSKRTVIHLFRKPVKSAHFSITLGL